MFPTCDERESRISNLARKYVRAKPVKTRHETDDKMADCSRRRKLRQLTADRESIRFETRPYRSTYTTRLRKYVRDSPTAIRPTATSLETVMCYYRRERNHNNYRYTVSSFCRMFPRNCTSVHRVRENLARNSGKKARERKTESDHRSHRQIKRRRNSFVSVN